MANEAMQKAFLADPERKLPQRKGAKEKPEKTKRGYTKRLQTSHAQEIREAYRMGIRDERLRWVKNCEKCGEPFTAMPQLHHLYGRKGRGYVPGNPGVDDPNGQELLHSKCHGEEHS